MYQKYIKHPITHGENYRQLRNQVNNLIRQSKAKYYQNLLKSQVNDNKNTWKTLNHLMNRNSKASNQFKIKKEDGNFTEDSNDIAEIFNQYFYQPLVISQTIFHLQPKIFKIIFQEVFQNLVIFAM